MTKKYKYYDQWDVYTFNNSIEKNIKTDLTLPVELQRLVKLNIIFKNNDFIIFIVDGEKIRDFIDIDFTEGGNCERYGYIPEKEIWIENGHSDIDICATILHELCESFLMKTKKMSYLNAHDKASLNEKSFRNKCQNLKFSTKSLISLTVKWYYLLINRLQ